MAERGHGGLYICLAEIFDRRDICIDHKGVHTGEQSNDTGEGDQYFAEPAVLFCRFGFCGGSGGGAFYFASGA